MCGRELENVLRSRPELLDRLSDKRMSDVLRMHYIDGLKWYKVAAKLAYSTENIFVIRRKAVNELQQILESEVN